MRIFFFDGDSSKFIFKTDDNLVYDEKINIPVRVISLISVIALFLNYKNVCMNVFLKKNINVFVH